MRDVGALTRPSQVVPVALAASLAVLVGTLTSLLRPSTESLIVVLIAIVVTAPLAYRLARHEFDIFEPLTVFCIVYAVLYLAAPLFSFFGAGNVPDLAAQYEVQNARVKMLEAILLGGVGFLAGYALRFGKTIAVLLPKPNAGWSPATMIVPAAAVFALGIVLFLLFVATTGGAATLRDFLSGRTPDQRLLLRATPGYLFSGIQVLIPAALLFYASAIKGRKADLYLLGLVIAVMVTLWGLPTGRRGTLMLLFVPMAVLFYIQRGRRPSLATAAIAVFVFVLVLTALGQARPQTARSDASIFTYFAETFSSPLSSIKGMLDGGDTSMSAYLAVTLLVVPKEFPFEYGAATVGDLVTRPIPGSVWPGKPLRPKDQIVAALWPLDYARGTANPAFPPMALFYYDFGWPGIFAGMALLGVLFRATYEYFRSYQDHIAIQVLYASLIMVFVLALRRDPVGVIVTLAIIQGPLLVAFIMAGAFRGSSPIERALAKLKGAS